MPVAVAPEVVMAMEVLKATGENRALEVEDISGALLGLLRAGVDFGDLALRRVPGGVYSEDVEAFVGRILSAGADYASARSPIRFGPEGLNVCKEILRNQLERHPEAVEMLASALKFDLDPYHVPSTA